MLQVLICSYKYTIFRQAKAFCNEKMKREAGVFAVSYTHLGLAQLARAPALQAGGQGFDSLILHSDRIRPTSVH